MGAVVGWVWFRVHDTSQGWLMLSSMFGLNHIQDVGPKLTEEQFLQSVTMLLFVMPFTILSPGIRSFIIRRKPFYTFMVLFSVLFILSVLHLSNQTEFIYFMF